MCVRVLVLDVDVLDGDLDVVNDLQTDRHDILNLILKRKTT